MAKESENLVPGKKLDMDPAGQRDVSVTLKRAQEVRGPDQMFWIAIRNRCNAISFNRYKHFIDDVMCGDIERSKEMSSKEIAEVKAARERVGDHFHGMDAYMLLKKATEMFLMHECGIRIEHHFSSAEEASRIGYNISENQANHELQRSYLKDLKIEGQADARVLPYLDLIIQKLGDLPLKEEHETANCYGVLRSRYLGPCLIELIWSYWHEEGMLVQTLNAISMRFQNARGGGRDPLARLDLDPLRRLGHFFWAYIQEEMFRLTLARRTYEYDHQYGLQLLGRAVPAMRPADSRSKFLESFHHLLNLASIFYKEDDDTTVIADGFPVLNALKDVHLLLAEGADNQFGNLAWTARVEMMIQQWLLARPEMREFLGGKIMVPYTEPWMDRVDTMKSMQGWSDVNIMHFRDLGVFGEQILLSIRYGAWTTVFDPIQAVNWARYWRPEIQSYIYAYRAVTGVDLTSEPVNATLPGILLRNRLALQQKSER